MIMGPDASVAEKKPVLLGAGNKYKDGLPVLTGETYQLGD
jgi:hypothetical protein